MSNDLKPLDEALASAPGIKPKIYSKKTIWGFSFIFTPVFGGILLMLNLKDIGNKKAGYLVLLGSVLYMVLTVVIIIASGTKSSSITYLFNIGGGVILSEYFFRKYFPDEAEYAKKKIWKALIIAIAISVLLFLLGDLAISSNMSR